MSASRKLSSVCLSVRDWILRASFHPYPALGSVAEVLLCVAHPPWVSCLQGRTWCWQNCVFLQHWGSLAHPALFQTTEAILNWSQGAFFGSPWAKSMLENLRALQDLPGALLMNPSPCHIFHHKPRMKPQKSTAKHFCCSRDSKNVHMQMCLVSASILEPKVSPCFLFSG